MTFKRPPSSQPLPDHARLVFKGVLFDVYHWDQLLYDGSTAVFEKLKRKDTVSIYPITADKKIVLTKQEQPGMAAFISCAGGIVEDSEDILTAAYRELLEESGYTTNNLELWYSTQASSRIEWANYVFFARNAQETHRLSPDPGEKIEVFTASFDEFIDLCADPLFRDSDVALKILRAARSTDELAKIRALFMGR